MRPCLNETNTSEDSLKYITEPAKILTSLQWRQLIKVANNNHMGGIASLSDEAVVA
jgi:hypothetical protein